MSRANHVPRVPAMESLKVKEKKKYACRIKINFYICDVKSKTKAYNMEVYTNT